MKKPIPALLNKAFAKTLLLAAGLAMAQAAAATGPAPGDELCATLLKAPSAEQIAEKMRTEWSIPEPSLAGDFVKAFSKGHLVSQFHERFLKASFLVEDGGLCGSVCLAAIATITAGPLNAPVETSLEKHLHETFNAVRDISKVENFDAREGVQMQMAEAYLQRQIKAGRLPRSLRLQKTEQVTNIAQMTPPPGGLILQIAGIFNDDGEVGPHHALLIVAVNENKHQVLAFDPYVGKLSVFFYREVEDLVELYHAKQPGLAFAEIKLGGLRLQKTMWSVF